MKALITTCFLLLFSLSAFAEKQKTHYLCVFDPVGRSGDIFTMAKDIALDFLDLGVNLKLYPYSTETAAKADFRAGLCDGIVLTGIQAREYNIFTTTIEAPGMVESYKDLGTIISTLAQPRASKLFIEGEYEVAGIYPGGAMFVYTNDKSIKAPSDLRGKRFFNAYKNKIGNAFIKSVDAIGVEGDTTNFAAKFNRGRVDATFAPAAITEALELDKGMGDKGGVIDVPVWILTMQVVIRPQAFNPGFGQAARVKALDYYERAIEVIELAESKLADYWAVTDQKDQKEWEKVFEDVRNDMLMEGLFDRRMLKLLRKLRCKNHPKNPECQ